jgi:hypothetical protein
LTQLRDGQDQEAREIQARLRAIDAELDRRPPESGSPDLRRQLEALHRAVRELNERMRHLHQRVDVLEGALNDLLDDDDEAADDDEGDDEDGDDEEEEEDEEDEDEEED